MASIIIRDDAHWRELRAQNVGGSEIAALFGECSYLTHLELWLAKHGDISGEIEDTQRMFWGRMVEEAIAQGVAKTKGWIVENPKAYYTCDDVPGMGCTPDRIIRAPERPEPGLLQIKNADWLVFSKWEEGQPTLQYQLQVQHELACTGYTWGALAVLVGGNDLKIFIYEAHAGAITKIKLAVGKFWESVHSGIQPPAVAENYDILKDLYPGQESKLIDLSADNEMPALCAEALAQAEIRKAAEKAEKTAKATILQKVGDAGRARCSGFEVKRTQVNKKEYVVKPQSYSQLTIKEEKAA